jgi:hypothetical protein
MTLLFIAIPGMPVMLVSFRASRVVLLASQQQPAKNIEICLARSVVHLAASVKVDANNRRFTPVQGPIIRSYASLSCISIPFRFITFSHHMPKC